MSEAAGEFEEARRLAVLSPDGVLAHWAWVVEEELARAERQRC